VESPDAPRHLVLGAVAYESVLAKLEAFRAEVVANKQISLGADFPKGERVKPLSDCASAPRGL